MFQCTANPGRTEKNSFLDPRGGHCWLVLTWQSKTTMVWLSISVLWVRVRAHLVISNLDLVQTEPQVCFKNSISNKIRQGRDPMYTTCKSIKGQFLTFLCHMLHSTCWFHMTLWQKWLLCKNLAVCGESPTVTHHGDEHGDNSPAFSTRGQVTASILRYF